MRLIRNISNSRANSVPWGKLLKIRTYLHVWLAGTSLLRSIPSIKQANYLPINIFLNIIFQMSRFTLLRRQSDASRVPASESAPAASRSVYQAFGPLTRGLDIAARFWQGSESRLCHLCVSLISLLKPKNISQKCAVCQQTLLGYVIFGSFSILPRYERPGRSLYGSTI